MVAPDALDRFTDEWNKFESTFLSKTGLVAYTPHMREFVSKTLDELRLDNIQYMEFHTSMGHVSVNCY